MTGRERPGWRVGRPRNRLRQVGIVLAALPGWLTSSRHRRLLNEMRTFVRSIPEELEGSLPETLERLSPAEAWGEETVEGTVEKSARRPAHPPDSSDPSEPPVRPRPRGAADRPHPPPLSDRPHPAASLPGEAATRRMADLASLLERRSATGKCLRRSLVRYHYLRRLGVPLKLNFGARVAGGSGPAAEPGRRLTGHAWVSLAGEPYFEALEDVAGYRVVVTWPPGQR